MRKLVRSRPTGKPRRLHRTRRREGKGRGLKSDIVTAVWIWYGEYEEPDPDELCDRNDPETFAMKHDLYDKLSSEAKEVISTILNGPADFVDACISPTTGRLRQSKKDRTKYIKKFFRKKWGSRLKVVVVFRELANFVKDISTIEKIN